MAINTQNLFNSNMSRFGADSSEERFVDVFFDALNSVKADLEIECDIVFTAPTDLQTNIELDAKYYTLITYGLKYHIATHGEWLVEDVTQVERRYMRAKKLSHSEGRMDAGVNGRLGDLSE